MPTGVTVCPAGEADLPALAQIDTSYPTDRFLALQRCADPPEHTSAFRWRRREPGSAVAYEPTVEGLQQALSRANLFLIGEVDGQIAAYLMIIVPSWTDAGEITDLAVHRPLRRRGAGRALVQAATDWARSRQPPRPMGRAPRR